MTVPTDIITEEDLHGYIDDQLDTSRRIEVEEFLSLHPRSAARVMADLRTRDILRAEMAAAPAIAAASTLEAARRLQRALSWWRIKDRARRIGVFAALVAAGWLAHAHFGPLMVGASEASPQPPAFVEDARDAHRTELLRAAMRSQPSVTDYDPAEILSVTQISLPDLPSQWRILDVQVFPTAKGNSVVISLEAAALGTVSLFATRLDGFSVIEPTVAPIEGYRTAYWQIGTLAYAVTGGAPDRALERAAAELSQTLY